MTDSTIDTQAGDGGFDVGSSIDLFAEIESDMEFGGDTFETDDGDDPTVGDEQTAADVFDQLRMDVGGGTDDIHADESPADIIASADEPDPVPDETVDEGLLADDDELAALLLTGRSTDDDGEFLWIDPEADGDECGPAESVSNDTDAAADSEAPTGDTALDREETVGSSDAGDALSDSDRTDGSGGALATLRQIVGGLL